VPIILSDMSASTHVPVLAEELLGLLEPSAGQTVVDCTFGGGGHAQMIARRLGGEGTLIAIDRDPLARERFEELARELPCAVRFIRAGYADALRELAGEGLRVHAVYFDLGMSSMQVDTRERGFSYSYDAPLDMRMDPDQELTAREIVAGWDERRLAQILRDHGEERYAGAIARAIVRRREGDPIESTLDLVDTIAAAIPAPVRFAAGHPAKRTFQALRIAVNDELGEIDRGLAATEQLLAPGGRLAVVSFHSLEDRRVKQFLRDRAGAAPKGSRHLPVAATKEAKPLFRLIAPGGVTASKAELAQNPRARSARLRIAERTDAPPPGTPTEVAA